MLARICHHGCRTTTTLPAMARMFSTTDGIFDVVIVGSGMIGSSLAAAIESNPITHGMRIAVLDRAPPRDIQLSSSIASQGNASPCLSPIPELRVSTLTPATLDLMHKVNAWRDLHPPNAEAFSTMQVWDTSGSRCIRWHASDVGADVMGYVVENSLIQASLLRRYQEEEGTRVECLWPVSLKHIHLPPYGSAAAHQSPPLVQVELNDGRVIRTRLLVGADGAQSQVRHASGLRSTGFSYHQRAVVATVAVDDPHHHTAWQRFLPTGPLALLPVRGGYSNIVWSTSIDHAAQLEALSPEQFAAAVNAALTAPPTGPSSFPSSSHGGGVIQRAVSRVLSTMGIGTGTGTGMGMGGLHDAYHPPPRVLAWVGKQPASFPLVVNQALQYVRPRLALIGDAAHVTHPLAGQGVNLGFADVSQLMQVLVHAAECGVDHGDMQLLRERYETPRLRANVAMAATLDVLKRVFEVQTGVVAEARNAGLGMLNATGDLKNRIMRFAMGL